MGIGNPIPRPYIGVSPSGKARDFDSRIRKVRILPPQPFDPLAQLVEHLTFNQGAWGSNPQWVTILGCAGVAEWQTRQI